ncbi:hypothetical protein BURMUCF1_A1472 [Burkholderia multivorans ATCC BAA-247]|uniref:Uncharacterized protein n=1 Tax=Burkholderia multivorans CGD2 TaxID=513052 RepID=B9BK97_9BURK|nr:hypothetical protein BURMUCGD2_5505 [Burkholderia multivorans CGD2]EEE16051.1 hypothetical protein BURMUCGD2M_5496 [Burkholderia multivorans CGD2M]EJO58292.1 hypothetical protein BURMUCF1_A1472 [Burkholderia multivorans ATCC BAA-247]
MIARTATSPAASSARRNGTPHDLHYDRFRAFACACHP